MKKLGIVCKPGPASTTAAPMPLESISAFIQVNGAVQGGFILSVDERLARQMAKRFMIADITDEEAAGYAVEVVAEISNIISGNALASREESDIFLGNPLMIVTNGAEVKANESVRTAAYATDFGTCICIFVPASHKAELASIITVRPQDGKE
jgi:CheY-specific phosphatase CheX